LAEFVGGLNLVNVVVNAIRDHRRENTAREKQRLHYDLARQRLDTERERNTQQAMVALARIESRERVALERLRRKERTAIIRTLRPSPATRLAPEVRERLLRYLLDQPLDMLDKLADDSRIGNIEAKPLESGDLER
jgi:hypothetical protein